MKAREQMYHVSYKIETNGHLTGWNEVIDQATMNRLREGEKEGGNIYNLRVIKEIKIGEEMPGIQQSPFHN